MNEQRAWIKSRRKRRLCFTAAMLALCLLVTARPDILETISGFAAELGEEDEFMSVSGGDQFENPEEEDADQSGNSERESGDQPGNREEEGTTLPKDSTVDSDDDSRSSEDKEQPAEDENDDIVESGVEPDDGNNDAKPELITVLPEGVSQPQITVTVQKDAAVQTLLERIAALPDVQEYMEKEPDIDNWEGDDDAHEEAYEEWMEGLSAYVEEALDIWEAYEALAVEQQAQIPLEMLDKLTAWVELAEQVAGNTMVMAAAGSHTCNGITFQPWTSTSSLPGSGNYYLTADVNLGTSNYCQITGTLTLCLNGHTISGTVSKGMIRVNGSTLNIYDCSASKSGRIYCSDINNPIQVSEYGVLNLYGGTVQAEERTAIPIGTGSSDSTGGTVNVYSGATIIGGTNGISVNKNLSSSHVNIYGGSIKGGGSGYPVNMQNPEGRVTIYGDAAISPQPCISTVTPIVSNTQVSNTYTIDYANVKEGDTVVSGSTDTVHYKFPDSSSYVLVPYEGNLIAAKSTYTVALNPNGGSGGTALTSYTTGQGAELPTDWKKTNYVFDGWYENTDLSGTKVERISNTDFGNKTYYAKWTAATYTVTYNKNSGTIANESNYTSYTYGTGLTLPTPTRTGYTFGGWYTSSGLTGTAVTKITTTDTEAKTYYAKWTAKSYTITYKDKNNATFSGTHGSNHPTKHTYGTATTLVSPTKTGYDFNGWYTKSDCTGSSVTSLGATAYTDNITLYAKWTAATYTVTYNKNSGTIANESNYTSYTYGTGLTLPTPTRPGYTFGGWYEKSDYSGTKVTTISTSAIGAKTYYAKWTANTYTVTYNKNSGTIANESNYTSYTYGTGLTLPTPTRTGYTFGGWYEDPDYNGAKVTTISTSAIGEKAYYAKWTAAAVTINATKCTHNGADKVGESGNYTVTFAPVDGYSIPAKVTVQIGGTTLASTQYNYDNTTGTLTIPRDEITGNITITAKAVKNPVTGGPGKDDPDNTVFEGEPDEDGSTVTYSGTYGEEYTPVIIVGGKEMKPGAEITWDEGEGKGEWTYNSNPNDEITVEFRKRAVTGITVTPGTLIIYADDAANESIDALSYYLKEHSSAQASYDNKTKGAVQADYTTTDSFAVRGRTYSYTASADGKTAGITLKVAPVTAAATAPAELMRVKKAGGYTAAEVAAWLPAQVTVTYTGDGYTARTGNRAVTWDTASIGTDFGVALGRETVNGTVALPAWATGQDPLRVSIGIEFIDKSILTDAQMKLSISDWIYGEQTVPAPQGSITVTDTNPAYTYLYSADNGDTWITAENLPKSGSGYIIPGGYQVKMIYTGDGYMGSETASFTVARRSLTVEKGTLAVQDRNYGGTTDATLKEGGEPELSGVVEEDIVKPGGTLSAVFTKTGPGKNIPVTVTGFELTGRDAEYYEIKNATLTLYATINNADGTPPSSGGNVGGSDSGNSGENGDGGNSDGGSNGDDNDGGSGDNGGSTPGDDSDPGTPAVTPPAVTPSADTPPVDKQPVPGTKDSPGEITETQPTQQPEGMPENDAEPKNADTDTSGQDSSDPAQTGSRPKSESGQQPENEQRPENVTVQTVQASADGGRVVILDEMGAEAAPIATGTVDGMTADSTILQMNDGNGRVTVIVTVVCEEQEYTAGVADTAAVANAVLAPEQIQLVNDGETIEVRIDVKDISETVTGQDKEVIERGFAEYQNEIPELTLGMYVDISMFIRLGEGNWDAVTSTEEPIEVIIGIPEELQEDGREFYIIRSHEGEYTLLNDMDNVPDTITISTDMFSAYAIAFRQTDTDHAQGGNTKCGLCHICPTFLGICCFIWLAVIIAAVVFVAVIVILRRKKETEEA